MADTGSGGITPGVGTSEFKLTVAAFIAGTILDAAGGAIQSLQAGGVNATWFATALAVLGVLVQIMSVFGYQKSRTALKVADMVGVSAGSQAMLAATGMVPTKNP